MASAMFAQLQWVWPFSLFKPDDLKTSARLVQKLSIPDQTKQFVFALKDPTSDAVVYILAVQNLSEQCSLDAEYLIKEVKPRAVIVQVAPSALSDIQAEEKWTKYDQVKRVPTSSFEVLKRCFREKISKDQYENFAGCQVLQEIFGVGFYGHLFTAKRAAEEINSRFLLLESPYGKTTVASSPESKGEAIENSGLQFHLSSFVPGNVGLSPHPSSTRFGLTDSNQFQIIKSLIPKLDMIASLSDGNGSSEQETEKCQALDNYQAPSFAQSFYPLLQDLHDIFADLPDITKALASAQKMLSDVNEGQPVHTKTLADVYNFRIAVEFLRTALNNDARFPIDITQNKDSKTSDFFELSPEEQSHVLFAHVLKSQAMMSGTVVVLVDASHVTGLRRHWNTSVPIKVADITDNCFKDYQHDSLETDLEETNETMGKKNLLADKPVVAVGAGATALVGVSSLSKALPASTVLKLATYKIPVALKFGFLQLKRALTSSGLAKIFGSSKLLTPTIASAGTKTSTIKFTASAEKIHTVTHTIISSAQRTSLLAMRTSFYEMMRRRQVRPFRFAPFVTFTCSMATCTALLSYGDGIECATESIPSVPMIISLGRGLQSLQHASMELRQTSSTKIKESLQSLVYKLKQ